MNKWSTLKKLMWLKATVSDSSPYGTKSGAVVTFNASAAKPLIAATVDVQFAQSGSGNPSQTNVRAITGWTGANIYVSATTDPESGETYAFVFPNDAGTVYGGVLDATGGKLTVTHAAFAVADKEWTRVFATDGGNSVFRAPCSNRKYGNYSSGILGFSDSYSFVGNRTTTAMKNDMQPYDFAFYQTSGHVAVCDDRYSTADEFKTSMGSAIFVYPLATPVEYTFTGQEITSLPGTNYIWSDVGDITVTYEK